MIGGLHRRPRRIGDGGRRGAADDAGLCLDPDSLKGIHAMPLTLKELAGMSSNAPGLDGDTHLCPYGIPDSYNFQDCGVHDHRDERCRRITRQAP